MLALVASAHAWDGCVSCMHKATGGELSVLLQTAAVSKAEAEVGAEAGVSGPVQDVIASKYHSTDDILSEITNMASTCDNLSVRTVDVGACSTKVVTMQTSGGDAANKKRLLLGFSMHGRELITSEVALYLSKRACNLVGVDSISPSEALANTIIDFVPVVNMVGRKRAEDPTKTGNSCINQRKNRNLVDLNRNFDFEFEQRSDTGSETYPGPSAMSECETQTLRDIVTSQAATKPYDGYIDIHAGEDAMGYVYGASTALSNSLDAAHKTRMQQVTAAINSRVFSQSSLGSRWTGHLVTMGGSAAYESKGCASDYMYGVQNIPFSMTWEVWRQPSSSKKKIVNLSQIQDPISTDPGVLSPSAQALVPQPEALTPGTFKPEAPDANVLLELGEGPIPDSDNTPVAMVPTTIPAGLAMPEVASVATPESKLPIAVQLGAEAEAMDLSVDGCFLYFNPVTAATYDNTVKEWSDAILVLAHEMGTHGDASAGGGAAKAGAAKVGAAKAGATKAAGGAGTL